MQEAERCLREGMSGGPLARAAFALRAVSRAPDQGRRDTPVGVIGVPGDRISVGRARLRTRGVSLDQFDRGGQGACIDRVPDHAGRGKQDAAPCSLAHRPLDVRAHGSVVAARDMGALQSTHDRLAATARAVLRDGRRRLADVPVQRRHIVILQYLEHDVFAMHVQHVEPAARELCRLQHAAVQRFPERTVGGWIEIPVIGILHGKEDARASGVDGGHRECAGHVGDDREARGQGARVTLQMGQVGAVGQLCGDGQRRKNGRQHRHLGSDQADQTAQMRDLAGEGSAANVDVPQSFPVGAGRDRRARHPGDAAPLDFAVVAQRAPVFDAIQSVGHRFDKVEVAADGEGRRLRRQPPGIEVDAGQMGPEAVRRTVQRLAPKRRSDAFDPGHVLPRPFRPVYRKPSRTTRCRSAALMPSSPISSSRSFSARKSRA